MSESLKRDLLACFARGVSAPLDDDEFDSLARRVFAFQYEHSAVLRGFADAADLAPEQIEHWTQLPLVPTTAFKALRLVSGGSGEVQAVFRTSGTSGFARGEHHVVDLALYHASLLPTFGAHLLPDDALLPLLGLVPPPAQVPDSSLSHMLGTVARELCADGSAFFVDAERGLDAEGLTLAALRAADSGTPVMLAGTAFAFVHWTDWLSRKAKSVQLPEGSRAMVTGGFKGRSRVLDGADLYAAIESTTGISETRIVGEYGMTEMLSQLYDPVLASGGARRGHFEGPPWVRTRVLDPSTLSESVPGEPGLIAHVDLANLHSAAAVLTEDTGRAVDGGVELLGRAAGSELRGCSLSFEELVGAGAARSA